MTQINPSRRDIFKISAALGVAGAFSSLVRADDTPLPQRGKGLRFAHLTDMHVFDERAGDKGYALALESIKKYNPEFIITGGDHVMDASGQYKEKAVKWRNVYEKVLAEHTKLPVYPCIGNHDVLGWTTKAVEPSDPLYGKQFALDFLKLKSRFYSFNRGGWHFVILDNIQKRDPHYYGDLDPEQTEWLKADLQANQLPTVVVTHIPLLSICAMFDGDEVPGKTYTTYDSNMHHNVLPLLKLLAAHNVKLCLSGHIHQVDRVDYLGIAFCCNGAVCGAWWTGPHRDFPEGYAIVDLYPDGTFENQYLTYGWKAVKG